MELEAYAFWDAKTQAFMRPQFLQSKGQALRIFGDLVNGRIDENNEFQKHPEDYSLFHIGSYDDSNGYLDAVQQPVRIVTGIELVEENKYTVNQLELFEEKLITKIVKLFEEQDKKAQKMVAPYVKSIIGGKKK